MYTHVYITIISRTYIKSVRADRRLWDKRMGVEMGATWMSYRQSVSDTVGSEWKP